MIKFYEYKACSTCQKAFKYLKKKGLEIERLPIIEQPPSLGEIKKMLAFIKLGGGSFKNLFNTSGQQYRELQIADKIKKGLSESEALQLLAQNGKLIKRPFVLTSKAGVVGFKPEQWENIF